MEGILSCTCPFLTFPAQRHWSLRLPPLPSSRAVRVVLRPHVLPEARQPDVEIGLREDVRLRRRFGALARRGAPVGAWDDAGILRVRHQAARRRSRSDPQLHQQVGFEAGDRVGQEGEREAGRSAGGGNSREAARDISACRCGVQTERSEKDLCPLWQQAVAHIFCSLFQL